MVDQHPYGVESARQAARSDGLADWVRSFLASEGSDNPRLGEELARAFPHWLGPVPVPLDQLGRWAGPPGHPVLRPTADDEWRDDVDELARAIEQGHEPPPVIASAEDGLLKLEDGNHRVEALRRAGRTEALTLIGFASDEERHRFRPPAG